MIPGSMKAVMKWHTDVNTNKIASTIGIAGEIHDHIQGPSNRKKTPMGIHVMRMAATNATLKRDEASKKPRGKKITCRGR